MKKTPIKIVFLAIFLLLGLSACGFHKEEPTGRKAPEVLLASDCGFDKLQCCKTEPTCTYGQQCCADPNNSGFNYCANDCSCGDSEEFCCAGNKCNGNGVCKNGLCYACGGVNQVCCQSGLECSDGLACQDGNCTVCGVDGGPCCYGDIKCLVLKGERAQCVNEVCQYCGFDGHKICLEGDKCLQGQLLSEKTCERCGESNQPCCNEGADTGYDCDPAKGLKCNLGFCSAGN
jgi:hypothetical protein